MKGFCSGFSTLLPLRNYKSGVEVKELFEMTKIRGSNSAGPFFANYSFCAFSDCRPFILFVCFLSA